MLVKTDGGTASIMMADGQLHQVPYTALGKADMLLQAEYHKWIRSQDYRRELVCRLCREPMDVESDLKDLEGSWELLMVCRCRALYGKISLSDIASRTTNYEHSSTTSGDS